MSALIVLDGFLGVLVLLQMRHLLGQLHVLREQFGYIWVLDSFFGQTRLERPAYIGRSDP